MGPHGPTPEELLRHLRALTPATAGHLDGSSPVGTAHGGMVGQEAQDRILRPHAVASEHGEAARPWLQPVKALGLQVTAAVSDDSPHCTEASKAVLPQARLHAAQCQTGKQSWGHLKPSRLSSRRQGTASGTEKTLRHCVPRPRSSGRCVGAAASSPPSSLWRQSRRGPRWQETMRVLSTAAAVCSGSWAIASTLRTAKPRRSAHCNRGARRSTRWTTILGTSCAPALTSPGSTRCGSCGTRGGGSTGVGQTQRRGGVCCADGRKTMTGSGLQQPGNTPCSYSRR